MNQFDQFQNALLLEPVSKNTYGINPDSRYFVGKTPHGGYLNALMHKALTSSVPHSIAISSSIQYLDRMRQNTFVRSEISKYLGDHHQVLLSLYKTRRYALYLMLYAQTLNI